YEAKIDQQTEIELLMKEVAKFYQAQSGVIRVTFIKRTHRQKDFNSAKEGEAPIRLIRNIGKITYVLHLILDNEETYAKVSKLATEKFYHRWDCCLISMPKTILGETIE
ncbi:MAG: hypothetical protein RRY35_08455, partial [Clostridiales bacterium]